jgi:tetratricopeptide (TPR) repeat protein
MIAMRRAVAVILILVFVGVGTWHVAGSSESRRPGPSFGTELNRLIGEFDRRIAADPGDLMSMRELVAQLSLRFRLTGDFDDIHRAEGLARELMQRQPHDVSHVAELANLLLTQHRFREAWDLIEPLPAGPASPVTIRFDILFERGAYQEAAKLLKWMDPESYAGATRYALWYDFSGDAEKALRFFHVAYERAVKGALNPVSRSSAAATLATMYMHRGDVDRAREYYEAAEEHLSSSAPVHQGMAWLAYKSGRIEEAIGRYRSLAQRSEINAHLLPVMADMESERGNGAAGDALRQRFENITRTFPRLFNLHLALEIAEREPEQALQYLREEFAERRSREVLDAAAWASYHADRIDEAIRYSDSSVVVGEPTPLIHYHRGMILMAAGRHEPAIDHLKKALHGHIELQESIIEHIRRNLQKVRS